MAVKNGKPQELNSHEKMLLDLLAEKERNIMTAFGEQGASFHRLVEERMVLEAGALGTTHILNPDSDRVEEASEEMKSS
jgi:hypothetical protein